MKRIKWLAAFLALVLVAAACGGDDDAVGANCDDEITVDTIEVWVHEGSEADAYEALIADFNNTTGQDLGLTVMLTTIPEGGYTDAILAAAAAGDLPDVIDHDGPTLANFAWAGHVVALDDCITSDVRDNLLPSIVEQGTYAGNLYSVGTFDSGLGLYAWKSALDQVGARIPTDPDDAWTAEEFEQILRDLQGAGFEHPLDTKFWYGTQGEWMTYGFSPITQSAGGDLVDRDELSADGVLNSPEVVEAFTTFQRWVDDGLIDKDAVDDSNFTSGAAPLSWVGHWMYNPYLEAVGDDLILVPLPDFGEGSRTGMGSWAWAITSAATDGDAAWAFVDFALSDDTILAITEANGAVPATASALALSSNHAPGGPLELFVTQLEGAPDVAVPRPLTPGYPTATAAFWTALDDIVLGADVQTALDEAVATIDADLEANEGYPEP
jgi:multiple sugar transport system substrate-binding protein